MTLKNATLLALVGMILLSVLLLAGFIRDVASAVSGLIPAIQLLRSLVYLVAGVTMTVFLYVFHKKQS
jgi:UPF0716 family protein affecting phage T7 exclusion